MISDLTVQRVRDIDILDVIKPYVEKLQRCQLYRLVSVPFGADRFFFNNSEQKCMVLFRLRRGRRRHRLYPQAQKYGLL